MPRKTTKNNETQTTVLTSDVAISSLTIEENKEKKYKKLLYPLTTNDIFLEVLEGDKWEIFNILFSGIRIKVNFLKCKDGETRMMLPSVKGKKGYINLASVPKELNDLATEIYMNEYGEE